MQKQFIYLGIGLLISFFMLSCTEMDFDISSDDEEFENDFFKNADLIKSEVSNGKIRSIYKYNDFRKIDETESFYFYFRYEYNNDGKLIKPEIAADMSMLPSSFPVEKTELMTAENSSISSYSSYEYNNQGKLVEIKNYFKEDGK